MTNRLAAATSPYLTQHAENPVDWFEWGEDAFAEARRRDVPILLSVGYAACHWCHVMAHETFEDPRLAAVINQAVVSVKVDREERPDIDAIYMAATTALTGRGGWPMTVFLTPDGRPFWAGTYFPPTARGGMPGFEDVIAAVAEVWRDRRDDVHAQADQITAALAQPRAGGSVTEPDPAAAERALAALRAQADPIHGGFGAAPKFPPTVVLEALLDEPGDRELVPATLTAMVAGGIHDQVAGGFARYSVDRAWVVPHFEKMLYDNALLLGLLAEAEVRWPGRGFDRAAEGIVAWLTTEMAVPDGFAASLDADSVPAAGGPAQEGAFYVWTPAELVEVLGVEDGRFAAAAYRVTEAGTFEAGSSTLQRATDDVADPARLAEVRARLLNARSSRPRPGRDDKVVTAWNGWLIGSLVRAGGLLDREDWVALAARTAESVWARHWVDGRLLRSSLDGRPGPAAVLEDYGALAHGLLLLAAATGDAEWLRRATRLLEVARRHFRDPDGSWFDTPDDAAELWMRPLDPADNVTWSGRSAVLQALDLLGRLDPDAAGDAEPVDTALVLAHPRFAGGELARLLDRRAAEQGGGPVELIVVGDPSDPRTAALVATGRRHAPARSAVLAGRPDADGWAALAGRRAAPDGSPLAYVCRGFSCRRPVGTVAELRHELRG